MLTQFFLAPNFKTRGYAWGGLFAFLLHHLLAAWVSAQINNWYKIFFDLLGEHLEEASGESSGEDAWSEARDEVNELLMQFMIIVVPMVIAHPISGYIRGRWLLLWRITLIDDYLKRWRAESAIEGASQRVQEDTARFGAGVENAVSKVLSAILKLVVFLPILGGMDAGLINVAAGMAAGGLVVSIVVGHPLVKLEVNNQVVEASLRQRLVLLETNPTDNNESFIITINLLRDNYKRLYMALAFFNYWLTTYNQWTIVLPFMLVSARVFAKEEYNRISLGELQSITHAFGEIFAAFATVTENWDRVNEFRATMRRLRHFEATLAAPRSCRASSTEGVEIEMRLADAAAVVTVVEDQEVIPEKLKKVNRNIR